MDADKLARDERLDPEILRPVAHRMVAQQETLTLIRRSKLLQLLLALSSGNNKSNDKNKSIDRVG